MIIDFHTHTFPDKIAEKSVAKLSASAHLSPSTNGTARELAEKTKAAGIGLSVIVPVATSPEQVESINTRAAGMNAARENEGIFSIAAMHPDHPDYARELRRIKALGLKGIKVHPFFQDTDLDDIRYLRIFEAAAAEGLFVITHTGYDGGFLYEERCTPEMARHVLDVLGDFPFVLAHMGGWGAWERAMDALADTKALLDTALSVGRLHVLEDGFWKEEDKRLLDEEGFMEMLKAFGAERILFGTDSPWAPQEETLRFLQALPISEKELLQILGGNAEKLLGISPA